MKSLYKYIAGICMALSVSSCNYLDIMPDDVVTVNSMFADRYTAERYLATCIGDYRVWEKLTGIRDW